MKNFKELFITLIVLMIIFCLVPSIVHAQGDPGGDPDTVPVDGGLTILAAAGVAYSVKKLKDYRKKKNNNAQHNK